MVLLPSRAMMRASNPWCSMFCGPDCCRVTQRQRTQPLNVDSIATESSVTQRLGNCQDSPPIASFAVPKRIQGQRGTFLKRPLHRTDAIARAHPSVCVLFFAPFFACFIYFPAEMEIRLSRRILPSCPRETTVPRTVPRRTAVAFGVGRARPAPTRQSEERSERRVRRARRRRELESAATEARAAKKAAGGGRRRGGE